MGLDPPPPSTCVHLSLTPFPLRVDVINGWPLNTTPHKSISNHYNTQVFPKTPSCLSFRPMPHYLECTWLSLPPLYNNNLRVSNIRVSNRTLIYNVCPKSALT